MLITPLQGQNCMPVHSFRKNGSAYVLQASDEPPPGSITATFSNWPQRIAREKDADPQKTVQDDPASCDYQS